MHRQLDLIFINSKSRQIIVLPRLTVCSGNDYKVIISQFEELYDQPLGPNGYDLTSLTPFRASRFQQSIDNNPYFFNGPFTGVLVQPAAYTFIYRFMSNKSAEYPEGYLNGDVLKSFFSITGDKGNFQWKEGYGEYSTNVTTLDIFN